MEPIDKKTFRKQMLGKRDTIPVEARQAADEARNEKLLLWKRYREAELLLFYVSYRSEADTRVLLSEALMAGKAVAVPKVEGQDMVFYRITDLSQLVEGYRGILEPDTKNTKPVDYSAYAPEKTILLVPGCAFDRKGGRMGYGGGFYDRYMEAHPRFYRVALAYEAQLVDAVPREAHDKRVNDILTELQEYRFAENEEE